MTKKKNVLKSFISVPKWVIPITISIGTALQYARLWKQTANRTISGTKTLTISRPRKKRIPSCLQLNRFSMIKKECYIWVGQIIEYRGMTLRKVRPGKYIVISPCSLVSRPVYIDKNENLNVL